jgi:hypothetical protein
VLEGKEFREKKWEPMAAAIFGLHDRKPKPTSRFPHLPAPALSTIASSASETGPDETFQGRKEEKL